MMTLQLQHLSFFNMINIKTIEEEENKTLEHIFFWNTFITWQFYYLKKKSKNLRHMYFYSQTILLFFRCVTALLLTNVKIKSAHNIFHVQKIVPLYKRQRTVSVLNKLYVTTVYRISRNKIKRAGSNYLQSTRWHHCIMFQKCWTLTWS